MEKKLKNTNILISEIQKHPAIYNTKLKEYSDKELQLDCQNFWYSFEKN